MGMMELKMALRLEGAPQVAFVGAGGKTTAMFQLAQQFEGPVLLTTSTHLLPEQGALVDNHIVVNPGDALPELKIDEPSGLTLITGPEEGARLMALHPETLSALSVFAREYKLPLLIEADGARQMPLKAPASHEAAIPDFVEVVVVLAGLSALGKTLDENTVHRPERFAELAEMEVGEEIGSEELVRVLKHPKGGLQNIPSSARGVILLNQVESDELSGAAKRMAEGLLPAYQAVVAAALAPVDGGEAGVSAVYERIAGVLLAAGESKRLGEPKQLLDWRGKSFVRQIVETAIEAELSPLVVVVGAYQAEVQAALQGLPIEIVHNPDWQAGQSGSVRIGLAALPEDVGAAAFLVVDQPQLPAALLEALKAEHARSLASIISPQVDGQRSNPVLFDRRTFPDFAAIEGDLGGRALFSRYHVSWIPWLDASLGIDVDTLKDYQRLLNYAD